MSPDNEQPVFQAMGDPQLMHTLVIRHLFMQRIRVIFIYPIGRTPGCRVVNTSGIITTLAGNSIFGFSGDGGAATTAEICGPMGIFVDKYGNVYFADIGNQRIRIINTSGIINTYAGNGTLGFSGDGGPATNAEFDDPAGICGDIWGNIYVADEFNNRVRKITANGNIITIAGTGVYGYSGELKGPQRKLCFIIQLVLQLTAQGIFILPTKAIIVYVK